MDSLAPLAAERSSVMSQLAEVDLIIKQAQWDLHETLELIDRLRAHYIHIQDKLNVAERQRASLLTEAARLFDACDLIAEHRAGVGTSPVGRRAV